MVVFNTSNFFEFFSISYMITRENRLIIIGLSRPSYNEKGHI